MPDDLIRRTDAKAAVEELIRENDQRIDSCDLFPLETKLRHQQDALRRVVRKLDTLDSVPAAGAGELESEIRSLIDDYRDSVAQEAGKNDTGDETLGLVILDLEKLIAADLTSRPDAAKREE